MLFSTRLVFLLLLVVPASILMVSSMQGGSGLVAHAQEDPVMPEEDMVEGEEEIDADGEEEDPPVTTIDPLEEATEEREEEEEESTGLKPSPDADVQVLFVKPLDSANLPSGAIVRMLVGFANRATSNKTFMVHSLDAAFRYPQDFSYVIQNFTESVVDQTVEQKREASFEYSFFVSENYNSRPFGLTLNVNYNDQDGNQYQNAVFNETVNIVDPEEGFDGETFFMYITLAALGVLLVIGMQQMLKSFGKKHLLSKPRKHEMGTQNNGDIDMDYIPKEHLQTASPRRRTPRTSPSQRRSRRQED